jgi:hypothetical protein
MGKAKIQIVGGDGQFFDQFVKAISLGQGVDGTLQNSEALQTVFKAYLDGDRSLPEDLRAILSRPGLSGDAQSLALTALLAKDITAKKKPEGKS